MALQTNKILRVLIWAGFCFLPLLSACDSVGRHKFLTTLFDGVPSLPPLEEYCEGYEPLDGNDDITTDDIARVAVASPSERSLHEPYAEKQCQECHNFEDNSGLNVSADKLCLTCHDDFIQGRYVHGPVAAGDCLACHEPHNSSNEFLLKKSPAELCSICHREPRLAPGMHEAVAQKTLVCNECHDPHFGEQPYFLR